MSIRPLPRSRRDDAYGQALVTSVAYAASSRARWHEPSAFEWLQRRVLWCALLAIFADAWGDLVAIVREDARMNQTHGGGPW